jgi:hypothetical protein
LVGLIGVVYLLTQLFQWNVHIQLSADQLNCFYTSTDEVMKAVNERNNKTQRT